MERKFKVWLDSGANAFSTYEVEIELDDLGLTSDEWDELTLPEQEEVMKDVAWERMDWGFEEIT